MPRRSRLAACVPLLLLANAACKARAPLLAPAPRSPIAAPGGAGNLALGDVNGDGHLDLAVASGANRGVAILLGDGAGAFADFPGSLAACGIEPGELCLGDVNEDGKLDLAVAGHDSHEIVVLLGDGRGGFARGSAAPVVTARAGKPHNHGLLLGDVDGDAHLDLAAADSEADVVAILLGDGKGGFAHAAGSPFAAGPAPYPPAFGDVDGDGRLDLVVPDSGTGRYYREHHALSRSVTVLLGDGAGGFRSAPGSPLTVVEGPYFAALGDVDGDRRPDLVTAHDDSDSISILLNDGGGRFRAAPQSPLDLGRRAFATLIADADGDGAGDLVLATGESVTVLLGDGRGTFAPAAGSPFAAGHGTWRLALGDIDEDGRLDAVASNVESDSISVFLGR